MLEARAQVSAMFREACPFVALVLVIGAGCEIWFLPGVPFVAFGALVGCIYAVANLAMLFWLLAPYFFLRQKPLWVLGGALLSLGVGALLMFAATFMGSLWALGLAIGIGSPAIMSLTTSKS